MTDNGLYGNPEHRTAEQAVANPESRKPESVDIAGRISGGFRSEYARQIGLEAGKEKQCAKIAHSLFRPTGFTFKPGHNSGETISVPAARQGSAAK